MGADSIQHDVIVIGEGSAGYAAARTARAELLDVRDQPESLLVLGGGPVALELGWSS